MPIPLRTFDSLLDSILDPTTIVFPLAANRTNRDKVARLSRLALKNLRFFDTGKNIRCEITDERCLAADSQSPLFFHVATIIRTTSIITGDPRCLSQTHFSLTLPLCSRENHV